MSLHKLLADSCGDELLDLGMLCPQHLSLHHRHSLRFASSSMFCGLTNNSRADHVGDIHPNQPAVQHQFPGPNATREADPHLVFACCKKTRRISIGSSVGGNMLTAKSAWSTAAPSKAVLIPALQNAHGQAATVRCKNTPGGKKLAESTGASEKNNDNKNIRNGIMEVLWLYSAKTCCRN